MKNEQERDLYFVGDIHQEWKLLVYDLVNRYDIKDANVVIVGDVGYGFCKKVYYDNLYKKLHDRLEKNNICIYGLAGNHDDRSWFIEENSYPRFKFLKDHETIKLSGKSIYPIFGATSIDDDWRKRYNEKMEKYGSSKRVWWETEDIVKKYKDLPGKVDIIASHTAPLSFDPVITRLDGESEETYLRDLENRKYLDYVFRNIRCDYWIFGHFHHSYTGSLENTIYKCLDINELYMYRL